MPWVQSHWKMRKITGDVSGPQAQTVPPTDSQGRPLLPRAADPKKQISPTKDDITGPASQASEFSGLSAVTRSFRIGFISISRVTGAYTSQQPNAKSWSGSASTDGV